MRALVLLSLLLASCSRPGSPPNVRIAVPSGGISNLPLYMAKALGHFEQEGVAVQLEELGSAGKVMEAVLGGSVEMGGSAYDQVLQAAGKGRDVQSFFVLAKRPNTVLAVAPRMPQIRRIEDLRGRPVGVASLGSSSHNILNLLLSKHEMTPGDITAVAIGSAATGIAALEHGKVDAAQLVSLPFEIIRGRHPDITVLHDSRLPEGTRALFGVPDLPITAAVASAQWLAKNGDSVRRVTRALARSVRWLREQPIEEVEAKLPESLRTPGSTAGLAALRIAISALSIDGRMPPNGPAAVRDFLAKTGAQDLPTDLSKTYTDEYLEPKP